MVREQLGAWERLVHALHVLLALSIDYLEPDGMARLALVGLARAVQDAKPATDDEERAGVLALG